MMTGWRGRRTAATRGAVAPAEPASPAGRLRPMVPADLADVMALEHQLFPDDPWSEEMFAEEVTQPPGSRLYLIAEAGADAARVTAGTRG